MQGFCARLSAGNINEKRPLSGLNGVHSERPREVESVLNISLLESFGTSSSKLMAPWTLSSLWNEVCMLARAGWLGKGNPGLADSWRNVLVNWVRKFERNDSEEQHDVVFK